MGARGPRRWKPTDDERRRLRLYAGLGLSQANMAALIGKSVDTLTRHARADLDLGSAEAKAKVGKSILQAAINGNITAAIFYAKTQMGWKETSVQEHTGKDGGPIDVRKLTDEDIDAIIQIYERAGFRPGA